MIEETEMYYEVGYRFPYTVNSHKTMSHTIYGEKLRCFEYALQAYVFQYKEKIIHLNKAMKNKPKKDRPFLRRKIKNLNIKLEKLIEENLEFFI